ncbi:MAG: pilus assembly protein PilM [Clostridiales bacterium]|nr:pilus assembly protein PilM [Clostridiales bacterium]
MPKRIGLEIGTAKTKIVVGHTVKNDFKITGYEVFDTVDGVYSIDEDTDLLRMELPIKEALSRLHIRSGNLFVTISNEKVIIRTRELPRVSPKEMYGVVRFEAENFLPYDIDAFYIDYKVLEEVAEQKVGQTDQNEVLFNVMIIAAPKEIVDQYIVLANKLKLKLKLATVYTEASTKFFAKHFLEEGKNNLFVDIGSKFTNMTMYEGFHYFANIKTERGISGMFDRLVDHHGYNEHDVKYYLYNYTGKANLSENAGERIDLIKASISSNETETSLKNLQKKLESIQNLKGTNEDDSKLIAHRNHEYDNLINEINRMVDFFKSRKYGIFVDNIYLFGGGAYLSNFSEAVEESIGVNCKVLPLTTFNEILDKESSELMVPAIGACLGGLS